MSLIPYPGAKSSEITDKLGETLSIFDFGDRTKIGRGDDDSPILQAAIDAIQTTRFSGGAEIYLPSGYVFGLATPVTVPLNSPPITIVGDGNASVIRRLADMPDGQGMINIKSIAGFRMAGVQIDGMTTVPVGLQYNSDFVTGHGNDPLHPVLTKNTSIWVHAGAAGILLESIKITHSGGYAVLLDATNGLIEDVDLIRLWIDNNRPHLFGVNPTDLKYGSWTGGILAHGDGRDLTSKIVRKLQVSLCRFTRNTGNCVWQHLYGLNTLHEHLKVVNNIFEDCGLDAVLVGGVENGVVEANSIRRVGYITDDDGSQSVPKWLSGAWGVGIDTSGVALSVNYVGNSLTSCNGGYIDADGFAKGSIIGNTLKTPSPIDPEYIEDQIGLVGWAAAPVAGGKNYAYGIQVSDTSGNIGGAVAKISSNNLINISGGGIIIFGGHNCVVSDNAIFAPQNSSKAPIILGNLGTSIDQRSYENIVHANQIVYNPTSPTDGSVSWPTGTTACVIEDASAGDFAATDRNWVFGNILSELSYEFLKHASSNSTTEVRFSSNANALNSASYHAMRREGFGLQAALKWYFTDAASGAASGVSGLQVMQLQGYVNSTSPAEPLLNLSAAGSGGVYATGPRVSSALHDAVLTGKVYLDSFLALTDTTYGPSGGLVESNPDADALPGTVALLRWSNALNRWRQSIAATGGVRIWTDFGGSMSVSGVGIDKEVIFNSGGTLVGSTNFQYDTILQRLTIFGITGTAAVVVANAFIQSQQGFYTPATNSDAIQAPSGGMTAKAFVGIRSDAQDTFVMFDPTIPQQWGLGISAPAEFVITNRTSGLRALSIDTLGRILIPGVASQQAIKTSAGYIESNEGYYSPSTSYQAVKLTDAFNVPVGGINARSLAVSAYVQIGQSNGIPTVTSGDTLQNGAMYYDTGSNQVKARISGVFVPLSTGGSVAGSDTWVQYRFSGLFAASANFTFDPSLQRLAITGISNTAAIAAVNAFISSDGGFVVPNINTSPYNATDVIQAKTGGVTVRYLIGSTSLTLIGETGANAGLSSGSGVGSGRIYFDSGTHHFMISEFGGAYVQLTGSGPAGSANWVQYNSGTGSFAASTNFTFDPSLRLLTITAIAATAGIAVSNGFISSDGGFLVPNINSAPYNSSDVIQAKAGGVTALSLISIRNDGSSGVTIARTSATAHTYGLGVNSSGYLEFNDSSTARMTLDSSGRLLLSGTGGYIHDVDSGLDRTDFFQIKQVDATMCLQATSSANYSGLLMLDNNGHEAASFQYANAGAGFQPGNFFVAARTAGASLLLCSNGLNIRQTLAASGEVTFNAGQITLSPTGAAINIVNGAVYYSNSLNAFQFRQNGAWATLGGGVPSVTGTNNQVLVNGTSGVAQSGALTLTLGTNVIIAGGFNSSLSSGVVYSAGFPSTTFQVFANGLVNCANLNALTSIQINSFTVIDSSANVIAGGGAGTGVSGSSFMGSQTSSYFDTKYNSSPGPYRLRGTAIIDNSATWVGNGANCNAGAAFAGYNIFGGAFGQTVTSGSFTSQTFTGGILTNYATVSDARLKNVLELHSYGLAEVLKLRPVMYEWNDLALKTYEMKKAVRIGLIAQAVQKVMPKAVFTERHGYLGYDPEAIIATLIVAVQELKMELDSFCK